MTRPARVLPSASVTYPTAIPSPTALQDAPPAQALGGDTNGRDAPLDPDARDRSHSTVTPVIPTRETNANRPSAQRVDRAPSGHPSIVAPFVPPPPLRHPHASRSSSRSHMPQAVMREPSRRMAAPQDSILHEFHASPGRELPELPRPDDEDRYMHRPAPSSYYSPSPCSGQRILTAQQPSVHSLPNVSTPSLVQEVRRSGGSSPGRGSTRGVSSRESTIRHVIDAFCENRIFLLAYDTSRPITQGPSGRVYYVRPVLLRTLGELPTPPHGVEPNQVMAELTDRLARNPRQGLWAGSCRCAIVAVAVVAIRNMEVKIVQR